MQKKASEVAESNGLHAAEMNVIDILGKYGPIPMGRLSRETFISPSNTTNTVKKLERAGLVKRNRSNNSDREVIVSLTAEGKRVFPADAEGTQPAGNAPGQTGNVNSP
jgi:DNA-binding MarR family transcriptional regulator